MKASNSKLQRNTVIASYQLSPIASRRDGCAYLSTRAIYCRVFKAFGSARLQHQCKCKNSNINSLVPELLTSVQALKLRLALEEDKKERDTKEEQQNLYKRFLRYVGRVEARFSDNTMQEGNCVLVWKGGLVVTALHILEGEKMQVEETPSAHKRKRKGKQQIRNLLEIEVTFPNTSEGVLQYHADCVRISEEDDLALLQAKDKLPQKYDTIDVLQIWDVYRPEEGDSVAVLSFPSGRGEEQRISHQHEMDSDLPWFATGAVTCFDASKGQGFADYSSFGGASGALIVHTLPNGKGYRTAIHLGLYHESAELPEWHSSQLPTLNASLLQKASNGYFTTGTRNLLKRHFDMDISDSRALPRFLHPQVAVKKVKKIQAVHEDAPTEEVLDLFGPWPGLDDVDGS